MKIEKDYYQKIHDRQIKNKYKADRYAVGEHIDIIEGSLIRTYEIIQVIPDKGYNKYLCKNKLGFKTTITDKDYYIKTNTSAGAKKVIKKRG